MGLGPQPKGWCIRGGLHLSDRYAAFANAPHSFCWKQKEWNEKGTTQIRTWKMHSTCSLRAFRGIFCHLTATQPDFSAKVLNSRKDISKPHNQNRVMGALEIFLEISTLCSCFFPYYFSACSWRWGGRMLVFFFSKQYFHAKV